MKKFSGLRGGIRLVGVVCCLALMVGGTSFWAAGLVGDGGGVAAASDSHTQSASPSSTETAQQPITAVPEPTVASVQVLGAVETAEAPEAAEDPELPSIMLMGDSITHGGPGTYTWRYFLYQHLAEVYGEGDFFVGPSQEPSSGAADSYAVPHGWDKDHAARSGRALDCYLDGLVDNETCDDTNQAAFDLEAHDPDLLVVLLGTNDVLFPWGPSTPAEFVAHAEQLVAVARWNNPTVSILLMGVLPVDPAAIPESPQEEAEINAGLEALATSLDLPTARVAYAPAFIGFDPVVHTDGGVHPNTLGDEVIAGNVAAGLADHFDIGK